ncbi:MAG: hypothetical protein L6Q81_13475 [Bacteroidia bacterium]|nr:hypothetical protein [Bacteroidia bacterium]
MKHVLRFSLAAALLGILPFAGCRIIDPAEDIPSYIRVNDIRLTITDTITQGSGSENITDAWIYVDGNLIGAFELPCTIPVLEEGTHEVLIKAGIRQNGLESTRAIYPFYKGWEEQVTFTRGQIVTVSPVITYFPIVNFLWNCNFDAVGTNIDDVTGATWPNLLRDTLLGGMEGKCGFVELNADTNLFYCQSFEDFVIDNGFDVYLELNYKCNQPFVVGIKNATNQETIPWIQVMPESDWNKIYIRLNDAITASPGGSSYYVYIAMKKDDDVANPQLYIDNIKLLN